MARTSKQDFLSVAEFARLIKVSALTVRRWDNERKYGKPKAKKVTSNGHRLYTLDQVTQYLKKHSGEAKESAAKTSSPKYARSAAVSVSSTTTKAPVASKRYKAAATTGAYKASTSKKRNVTKERR